jgi:hypothetical protein
MAMEMMEKRNALGKIPVKGAESDDRLLFFDFQSFGNGGHAGRAAPLKKNSAEGVCRGAMHAPAKSVTRQFYESHFFQNATTEAGGSKLYP